MNAWGIAAMLGCALLIGGAGGFAFGIRQQTKVTPAPQPAAPTQLARSVCGIPVHAVGDAAVRVTRSIPMTPQEAAIAAAKDLRERASHLRRDARRYEREAAEFEAEAHLMEVANVQ